MECMYAQTRPRLILPSKRFGGGGGGAGRWGGGVTESEPELTPREKFPLPEKKLSPEEYRTHDAASSRTASPTYYQRAIPAPGEI